jgi:PIN domain nuclease of toxin-antitoxin system
VIYLDTHAAIWAAEYQVKRFTEVGRRRLEEEEVRLSPMVLAELCLLHEIGRIEMEPQVVLRDVHRYFGAQLCDRPFEDVALAASWLKFTRDPFDRLLCAQALAGGGDLLTKDEHLLEHFPRAVW